MLDREGSVKISLMNSEPYLAFHCEPSPTRAYSSNWPVISRWWSPEVFEDSTNILTVENDIWAFGCVMLEVVLQHDVGLVDLTNYFFRFSRARSRIQISKKATPW